MKNKLHIFFFFALFLFCNLKSQTNNIDFELTPAGAYTTANAVSGWTVSSHTRTNTSQLNVTDCSILSPWLPSSQEFSIVSTPIAAFPVIGNIPHSPLGGLHVARLNNSTANGYATKLTRTYFVTSSNSMLQIAYAGAWQDPLGFEGWCNPPFFEILIRDSTNAVIPCKTTSFTPLSGGQTTGTTFTITNTQNSGVVFWSNWQIKNIDLSPYLNTTITIEIVCADCINGDHFGTVFIDADFPYTPPLVSWCTGMPTATLTGPSGYYSYDWHFSGSSTSYSFAGLLPFHSSTIALTGLNSIYTYTIALFANPFVNYVNICSYSVSFSIISTTTNIYQIKSKPSCPGGASGSATVIANTATSYSWINSTNSVVSTSSVANNLAPGIYTVNVFGCGNASGTVNIPTSTLTLNTVLKPHCGNECVLSYPGGTNYQWYFNTAPITSSLGGTAPSYTINAPVGQPSYVVSYDSPNGCRDSILNILTATPSGSLAISLNKIICPNSSTNSAVISLTPSAFAYYSVSNSFSVFSIGASSNYSVSVGPTSSNFIITSSLIAGSTYSVNAFDGFCTYKSSFTVTPFNYTITPSPSPTLCQTSGNYIIANVSLPYSFSNSLFTYSWVPSPFIFNGYSNFQSAFLTPSATPGSLSTIIYTVIVTPTALNCPLTKTIGITIADPPPPVINLIPQLCKNANQYSISTNPPGGTFINGAGSSIGTNNGIITPSLSALGTNNFTYATSIGPCVAKSSGNYTINPLPSISITGNIIICKGQSAMLIANGATTYTWNIGSQSPSISVTQFVSASYTVEGTDSQTNCYNTKTITVNTIPYPSIVVWGDTIICLGKTTKLSALGAITYTWSNGSPTQTINVAPNATTTYTLKGTSALASCSSTQAITVHVVNCNTTGVLDRNAGETFRIYPNPSNSKFFIEAQNILSIVVTDELGKIILEEHFQKENYDLDLSSYSNGVYILKVFQNNEIKTVKLIKND
ncbi:T9SS type A sorting domain-containing protein [Aurantibacillus circumpalustris]|uniref:T9SS type A sorting domain-containing protein n=1 Tax=Aurantibacillus circumpalustris TaxID=3036359 RepID=UPI00295A6927|nr:T9SS type A sorting domain-containing protein [Aurantibacillus circumpalustris]